MYIYICIVREGRISNFIRAHRGTRYIGACVCTVLYILIIHDHLNESHKKIID
jgi:hypothetical protein